MKPIFTDPIMNALHDKVSKQLGPIEPIKPATPTTYFQKLSESIVSQQLAVKAASTIKLRLLDLIGADFQPDAVGAIPIEQLRSVGLSQQKARYIHAIAEYWQENKRAVESLESYEDEQIIEMLTTIKGVGRWTAEMFLIFTLGRPDVFSVGDFALRKAVRQAYMLPDESGMNELTAVSQQWRPQRSLAARTLWKSLELSSDNSP